MDVIRAIETRRSIRRYQQRPVEEEKLRSVLEAGRLAPSAGNRQAWRTVAVRDPSLMGPLADACGGQQFVAEAPAALVVCALQHRLMTCGQPADTIDCSIALAYMQLRAWELGLGTCWLGFFYADRVAGLLEVPASAEVVAVSPLGYPAERPAARARRPFDALFGFDRWGGRPSD